MPKTKISEQTYREIKEALAEYEEVCERNLGTPNSKNTYKRYARFFVRWLNDEFTPGENR